MERVVGIGDVVVRLVAADGRRASALARAFGELREARGPAAVTLHYAREALQVPDRAPDANSAQLRLWFDGPALAAAERTGMNARVAMGEVQIGGSSFDPTGALRRLMLPLLAHALYPLERFVLHAAALSAGGSGWLVLGASGQGKSTTSYAAHLAGWGILDDDLTLLRTRRGEVEVGGLGGRPVAIPGELLEARGHGARPLRDADARNRLGIPDLRPAGGWAPLTGLIVVGHGQDPAGSLSRLAPARVMGELLKAWSATINPHLLPRFFALATELARRPAFQLLQGRDPAGRLDEMQRHLQEIAAGCGEPPAPGSPTAAAPLAEPATQPHH